MSSASCSPTLHPSRVRTLRVPCPWLITLRGEAPALLRGHAVLIRCVHITIDVGAARATNGEGLSSQRSSQGSVHLGDGGRGHPQVRPKKHQFPSCHQDKQVASRLCCEDLASPIPVGGDCPVLSEAVSWELTARRTRPPASSPGDWGTPREGVH